MLLNVTSWMRGNDIMTDPDVHVETFTTFEEMDDFLEDPRVITIDYEFDTATTRWILTFNYGE